MPVIMEEEIDTLPEGFQQLIDETHLADVSAAKDEPGLAADRVHPQCPNHPDVDGCLCQSFVGEWDLADTTVNSMAALDEPDYSKFEYWIPYFYRPEKPCDYCRARRLDCYVQRGLPHCNPCASLFRECSLTNSNTLEATNHRDNNNGTFLDTLHHVFEDSTIEQGGFTGIKPLKSKGRASGTATPVYGDDAPGSSKRNGLRFPRQAIKVLRDWLELHADNPYPTEEEKLQLEQRTELSATQIANWLANARRRRKATEKSKPRPGMSPSLKPRTPPIAIPTTTEKSWDDMIPLERWKNSPPENEPASIRDIANAVANTEFDDADASTSPSSYGRHGKRSSNGSGFSHCRAPSTTSHETISGQTSSLSASSAACSHGSLHSRSTHGSFGSFNSSLAGKKDRRRRRRPVPIRASASEKARMFQCTFCTDTFKSKYDWTRHEKSLHLSLEKWICAPSGPIITNISTGEQTCAYCDAINPDEEHLETHNHRQCEDKGLDARTFYRKDHLRQHLRLMHGCALAPRMESWKSAAVAINSRCGFCAQRFSTWQERVDHLTAHFKAGARMADWRGCRGLDPAVAALVTNAMPPYLIGTEAISPCPFSATNRPTCQVRAKHDQDQDSTLPGSDFESLQKNASGDWLESSGRKTTCWEVLTIRLATYVRAMGAKGVVMTDEMLQNEARRIVYDSDDSWDQTAADNQEWLDLFKKATGLDFVPSEIGGQGLQVPEDLETYQDLGLRIPFAVQLQAYNQCLSGTKMSEAKNTPGPYQRALELRRSDFKAVYNQLSQARALYEGDRKCSHAECEVNQMDVTLVDDVQAPGPRMRRWCNEDISPQQVQDIAQIRGTERREVRTTSTSSSSTGLNNEQTAKHKGTRSALSNTDAAAAKARAYDTFGIKDLAPWQSAVMDPEHCAQGSQALGRAELCSSNPFAFDTVLTSPSKGLSYFPRHKYQLPADKARLFATTTDAWEDSGRMPDPVSTFCPLDESARKTSTGAIMEFLGGELGASLPFSSDALTSDIQLDGLTWDLPNNPPANNAEFDPKLEEFIQATTRSDEENLNLTVAHTAIPWSMESSGEQIASVPSSSMHNDTAMDDIGFDDFDFDGVFDMQLDGAFDDGNAYLL